ncbi:hypothetical protein M405DRAFT_93605 [Rhizopogon salebrosus TDB-379]|nr:hypothetical protein M405DRAFT_93605 [Rhizopogon salebrosus TDB-379]
MSRSFESWILFPAESPRKVIQGEGSSIPRMVNGQWRYYSGHRNVMCGMHNSHYLGSGPGMMCHSNCLEMLINVFGVIILLATAMNGTSEEEFSSKRVFHSTRDKGNGSPLDGESTECCNVLIMLALLNRDSDVAKELERTMNVCSRNTAIRR